MRDKIISTIESYGMLLPGDRVTAAVSGGADSVALLLFLAEMAPQYGIRLAAVHVNHHLRGEESDGDEQFVRQLCQRLQVPLTVAQVDVRARCRATGESMELAARQLRYDAFYRAAKGGKIATAHTQDDAVETLLFHLARGTGLAGMGIPPVRDRVIRPMIGCTRREVEAFLRGRGQPWREDSSNGDLQPSRNRIRHRVLPVLAEAVPGAGENIARFIQLAREDEDYLSAQAEQLLCDSETEPEAWQRGPFLAAHPAVAKRALLLLLRQYGAPVSQRRVEDFLAAVRAGRDWQAAPQLSFRAAGQCFCACAGSRETPYFEVMVDLSAQPEEVRVEYLPGQVLILKKWQMDNFEFFEKKPPEDLKNLIDYDKINRVAKIRQRQPADRYEPRGRGCTKTLKKLFQEAGIRSLARRGSTPVLADEEGILWVEGFGAAARAGVCSTTRICYEIICRPAGGSAPGECGN